MSQAPTQDDVWLPSNCEVCSNRCGILAHRLNGVVVKIEGDPQSTINDGRICSKGLATLMAMYSPHRVVHPLKRTNPQKGLGVDPQWQQITWDEALNDIADHVIDALITDGNLSVLSIRGTMSADSNSLSAVGLVSALGLEYTARVVGAMEGTARVRVNKA